MSYLIDEIIMAAVCVAPFVWIAVACLLLALSEDKDQ